MYQKQNWPLSPDTGDAPAHVWKVVWICGADRLNHRPDLSAEVFGYIHGPFTLAKTHVIGNGHLVIEADMQCCVYFLIVQPNAGL